MDKNQREELKFQKYIALNVPNKVYTIRLVPYVKTDVIIYLAGAFNITLQKIAMKYFFQDFNGQDKF